MATAAVLLGVCLAVGAGAAWTIAIQHLNGRIDETKTALKRLHLAGRIPPNESVMDYLQVRTDALTAQYQRMLQIVAPLPEASIGEANPQLHFQERVHEVQRTLERLVAARGMDVPLQLGFPKELPPADTVPQLLIQLKLIEDAAELIIPQPISKMASVKLEDPQAVARSTDTDPFLTRLPVRLRVTCTLETLTKLLGLLDRMQPLTEFQAVRLRSLAADASAPSSSGTEAGKPVGLAERASHGAEADADTSASSVPVVETEQGPGPDELEVELVLARYLAFSTEIDEPRPEPSGSRGSQPARRSRKRGPARGATHEDEASP
ncbi:MAG: hypothetical protein HYZ92_00505 [Candidatus Omnitrophica bacterium]|nr:hypothetical protein [Candidatus Omnitrophota bacterium]